MQSVGNSLSPTNRLQEMKPSLICGLKHILKTYHPILILVQMSCKKRNHAMSDFTENLKTGYLMMVKKLLIFTYGDSKSVIYLF